MSESHPDYLGFFDSHSLQPLYIPAVRFQAYASLYKLLSISEIVRICSFGSVEAEHLIGPFTPFEVLSFACFCS
jgi:hypothetical protein